MSKDKGTKNHKKAPADKSLGKTKASSDYKSESKGGLNKQPGLDAFISKTDTKSSGNHKH
jgi:hypothetical protein